MVIVVGENPPSLHILEWGKPPEKIPITDPEPVSACPVRHPHGQVGTMMKIGFPVTPLLFRDGEYVHGETTTYTKFFCTIEGCRCSTPWILPDGQLKRLDAQAPRL